MPWTQKQMLRDANGDLIPQYWDVVEQEFKPLTGSDGANDVRLTGSSVVNINASNVLGSIPAGATKSYTIDLMTLGVPAKKFSFVARRVQGQETGGSFLVRIRHGYPDNPDATSWGQSTAAQDILVESGENTVFQVPKTCFISPISYIQIVNTGDIDINLRGVVISLWLD